MFRSTPHQARSRHGRANYRLILTDLSLTTSNLHRGLALYKGGIAVDEQTAWLSEQMTSDEVPVDELPRIGDAG